MSDRIIELRIENQRLKEQVQDLENKVLSLVGMISLDSSGGPEGKDVLNELIIELIHNSTQYLNIVSPKIDRFYGIELRKIAQEGVSILIITNDRGVIPGEYQAIYDDLKATQGIKMINNPNVRYLLLFNEEKAVYSGGSLDKKELQKSILIATVLQERAKLRKINEIFNLMLPSFMRAK